VLEHFQTKLPDMLQLLKELVELESPSQDKVAIDRLVAHLEQVVTDFGGRAEVVELPERGNHLLGTFGRGEEQLLILCHIDTVWDVGETAKRPFRIEDGKAYGPGVSDMKVGSVQALYALKHLVEQNWPLSCQVKILFNSDEETGSQTSRRLIEQLAKQSRAVFVLEPSIPPQGALKTGRKGVGRFDIKVEGVASHAGADPEKGASAVLEMAKQIVWLHSLNDFSKGTTVNVGVVRGGTRPNVVAAEAHGEIDLRVATMEEAERVVPAILARQAETPGTKVTITGGLNRPPMERSERIVELYRLAERIADELGIEICEGTTGGGSDGNFTAALGIPTIDGLGAVGGGGHAITEFLYVDKIPERTALLTRLLMEVGR
jgi:glutamate carboxypeptidase